MEGDSEGERSNESKKIGVGSNSNHPSNDGGGGSGQQSVKPKRQMKTPFQLETLEKAYALETYPSEATRAELSEKLGLSDRQLQMWFCHRRLKDKKDKDNQPKKQRKPVTPVMPDSPIDDLRVGAEPGSDYGSGSGSGSSPYLMEMRNAVGSSSRALMDDVPIVRRSYESQQSIMELRAIACVEAQLGEPLREDGPILGMEFDPLPPDAFGAPLASIEQQKRTGHSYENKIYDRHDMKSNKVSRTLHDYQSLQEQPYFHGSAVDGSRARTSFVHGNESALKVFASPRVHVLPQHEKTGLTFSSPNVVDEILPQRDSSSNNRINAQSTDHPIFGTDDALALSEGQTFNNDSEFRTERGKQKRDEARIAREVEANEMRMRKELERLDILRRKSEERMRKEMEKQERERRKEEERLLREKQREEERTLREQKREMERREKFLQKEYLRAEKRRQKEEQRMEKQAARRKVAIEKATARKMAKESMDLIEDEQLELMDLAAASKGLSCIIHLDHDALQNLELFRDSLSIFPPKLVQLKRPFAVQPWTNSEENIGNLLMVWRFFITFADVLGLWPFTLDEFVQAFHDFDSRLLGEIHVALLRSIIKDIEDVARTPTGLGVNQYCAANPEGGHPRIIEGAYAWGFDIRNWQKHLNTLTWPEIFRQLALAAGFGPQLKKRSAAWNSLGENHQGKGGIDAVSTIRNGSAAENAFAWMREKGLLLPRRSRHKLTPGTVKFAAFHVLSLEGSKGLTVLELAEKIQKSGLRDLTTSKTPEASISVALTRDTKLFERIAPSTYCVRPAFRKDPADAEAILATARKKIRIFENGFLGGEDADDVERDEDSECDVDEDPEVEDLATPLSVNKSVDQYDDPNACTESAKGNIVSVKVEMEADKEFSPFSFNSSKNASGASTSVPNVAGEVYKASNLNQDNVEIDESKPGESWIQGLSEGDYSHLSVEERLNALVALIGVANEGNSIRSVLEERLEASNSLKKQMWAEAQVDKNRLKEDHITRLDLTTSSANKTEIQNTNTMVDGGQSPLLLDNKMEASPSLAEDQKSVHGSGAAQTHLNDLPAAVIDPSINFDNIVNQQHGYASKRSRSRLKAYIAHLAEEMYVYRSLPLGQDRRRNRYWQFVASASRNDPSAGRIFVELHNGHWRLIDTEEAFDALLTSLDTRGIRESHLRIMLQKIEKSFKENVRKNLQCAYSGQSENINVEATEMDVERDFANFDSPTSALSGSNSDSMVTSSSFRIELGRSESEKKAAVERYQDFQRWMWKDFNTLSLFAETSKSKRKQMLAVCDVCLDCYLTENIHCPSCHQTFSAADNGFRVQEHVIYCEEKRKLAVRDMHIMESSLPLGIRLLKHLLSIIEASVPPEAWETLWTEELRRVWGMKLNVSSSAEEILQILTLLESGIKRQYLLSKFETTKELLGVSNLSTDPAFISILPWIPKAAAAVAVRLLELDASIMYIKPEKAEPFEDKVKEYAKLPSRFLSHKNNEAELNVFDQSGHMREENFHIMPAKRKSNKRGKGSRDHGWSRKYHKKVPSISGGARKQNVKVNGNLNNQQKQQLEIRTNGGRGRRTVRKRSDRRLENPAFLGQMADAIIPKSRPQVLQNLEEEEEEEWSNENARMMNMDDAENSNSAEAVDSDDNAQAVDYDDNAQAVEYEQGNWEVDYNDTPNVWNRGVMEVSEEEDGDGSADDQGIGDASADDQDMEEVGEEDSEGELDMSDASDQNGIDDGGDSEYSD